MIQKGSVRGRYVISRKSPKQVRIGGAAGIGGNFHQQVESNRDVNGKVTGGSIGVRLTPSRK